MAALTQWPHPRQLLAWLADARAQTDAFFALLQPEATYERPIPERHRLIFYLGHLEAFDWNLIARGACGRDSFHRQFDKLFAFGIDPSDRNLPNDDPHDWPSVAEVRSYNERVRDKLDGCLLERFNADPSGRLFEIRTLLHVAIEHRLMHAETLAYMLHQLPLTEKGLQHEPLDGTGPAPPPRMVTIPEGIATLGQARCASVFGWDNEFEQQHVEVPSFQIGAYPVTNGQFLEFLRAGGYQDKSLWSPEDWNWRSKQGISQPRLWVARNGPWIYRAAFSEIPLPLAWPVYVSHAEASAYARWAGKSLPTEAQWHRAAYGTPEGIERSYPWGDEPPGATRGNLDFRRWNATPVDAHPNGASAFGVVDLLGNGWEWTSTPFAPLPGFQPFPFYPGYSADFFDGRHFVMKGGSPRTASCLLRRSFRNWFQGHYPYVYATFRCVED